MFYKISMRQPNPTETNNHLIYGSLFVVFLVWIGLIYFFFYPRKESSTAPVEKHATMASVNHPKLATQSSKKEVAIHHRSKTNNQVLPKIDTQDLPHRTIFLASITITCFMFAGLRICLDKQKREKIAAIWRSRLSTTQSLWRCACEAVKSNPLPILGHVLSALLTMMWSSIIVDSILRDMGYGKGGATYKKTTTIWNPAMLRDIISFLLAFPCYALGLYHFTKTSTNNPTRCKRSLAISLYINLLLLVLPYLLKKMHRSSSKTLSKKPPKQTIT